MTTLSDRQSVLVASLLLWLGAVRAFGAVEGDRSAGEFFEAKVRPLLAERCHECHGEKKQKAGLRLDSRAGWMQGGESGPALVPGKPEQSLILTAVSYTDPDLQMPPKKKLSDEEIAVLNDWVKFGAPDPRESTGAVLAKDGKLKGMSLDEAKRHWAFQPLVRPELPTVADARWPRNPLDRFILAGLEKKKVRPVPAANRGTLVRRVYFDLIGLPPTPEDVSAFERNDAPEAYDILINGLLASPQFGERWGRHWLDLARYADSAGYEDDHDRPTAWHYRDFVIRAFNDDMPYDQFVRWQLAGDELESNSFAARIATAFIGLGPEVRFISKLPAENTNNRYNDLDDMLATTGQALLGLTVGCARCHDHKFDPIPTRDYYRMLSAFTPLERHELPLAPDADVASYRRASEQYEARLAAPKKAFDEWLKTAKASVRADLEKERAARPGDGKNRKFTDADYRGALAVEQRDEWDRLAVAVKNIENEKPTPLPTAMIMARMEQPPKNFVMTRGEPTRPGEAVEFGFLTALMRGKVVEDYRGASGDRADGAEKRGERAALAAWITDTEHGAGALLARVIVNRLWQHHFGEGLVRTPSDFGRQGDSPSHPELLDWLASELVRGGWKLKPIHRLIVTSASYRQRGAMPDKFRQVPPDPENRLFGHRRPQRLEAEIMRDHILAVSGCLNPAMYGPGVKAPIPAELNFAYNAKDPYPTDVKDSPETWRRSIYLFTKRSLRQPLLEVFDGADPSSSCGRRIPTVVAPQALALLNDGWIRARARDFARRLEREAGDDRDRQIRRAFRLALSREPRAGEFEASLAFVAAQAATRAKRAETDGPSLALADFCHTLFGLNEFVYVD